MDRWTVRELSELVDAIIVLGVHHPVVRELMDRLEGGELSVGETTAVLKRCDLESGKSLH